MHSKSFLQLSLWDVWHLRLHQIHQSLICYKMRQYVILCSNAQVAVLGRFHAASHKFVLSEVSRREFRHKELLRIRWNHRHGFRGLSGWDMKILKRDIDIYIYIYKYYIYIYVWWYPINLRYLTTNQHSVRLQRPCRDEGYLILCNPGTIWEICPRSKINSGIL